MKLSLKPVVMSGVVLALVACSAENTDYSTGQTTESSGFDVTETVSDSETLSGIAAPPDSEAETAIAARSDAVTDIDASVAGLAEVDETTGEDRLAEIPADETPATSGPVSSEDEPAGISTIATLIYADWCPSCKVLDPAINAARAAHQFDGIEFITLDYTGRDQTAFFADADAAGIGMGVRERFADGIKTGLLLVFDSATGEIVAELTKADNAAAIAEKLNAL